MVKNFQQKKHAQTETVDRYLQVRKGGKEGGREGREGREEEARMASILHACFLSLTSFEIAYHKPSLAPFLLPPRRTVWKESNCTTLPSR
jgi:hypothetical protein